MLRVWRFGRPLLLAYLAILVVMMFFENNLIFVPLKYPQGNWQPTGVEFEDAWFRAADDVQLHGWYVPHEDPLAVVLFCHGNAGNVTHREDVLRALYEICGVSVLVFDYRGYGRSQGSPDEEGVLADARAARTWLAEREGIPEERIVLMGESLGGAVAVHLAAESGAAGVVLENSFSSLPDVAAYHFPWLPVRLLMQTRLDATEKIASYTGPLFQSHGDCDTIVPYEYGRRLFDAAKLAQPKEFLTIPGCNHNDLHSRAYYLTLRDFLAKIPEGTRRRSAG